MVLNHAPLPVGLPELGARRGIRTHTVIALNDASPASWTTRAKMVDVYGIEPPIPKAGGLQPPCVPTLQAHPLVHRVGFEPTLLSF